MDWVPGVFDTVINWPAVVKNLLKDLDYHVQFEGQVGDKPYKNKFNVQDLTVRFADELTDPLESTVPYTLDKPLCVLYVVPFTSGVKRGISGKLMVEFQIIVNSEPQGRLNLDGYTTLMRSVCDPTRNKGLWMAKGLAPREVNEGKTLEGGELLERFKGRIFLRSVLVSFDMIGENIYAR